MQVTTTPLNGLLILEPKVFGDDRGFVFESFNQRVFDNALGPHDSLIHFVQDNHSKSIKGVLRGLHYQTSPHAQGKLIRVVQGEIWDVAVDIRDESPTRGQWFGVLLSSENNKQVWLPPGFAHGFVTLSDSAEVLYKATNFYSPEHERCLAWNDPTLAIDWQLSRLGSVLPQLSAKDKLGATFK
jgi:dTDP-4-dehydrorhamnose 3,5-epimerase